MWSKSNIVPYYSHLQHSFSLLSHSLLYNINEIDFSLFVRLFPPLKIEWERDESERAVVNTLTTRWQIVSFISLFEQDLTEYTSS